MKFSSLIDLKFLIANLLHLTAQRTSQFGAVAHVNHTYPLTFMIFLGSALRNSF
ncbi:hypothetical protein MANES_14G092850v8 [Manihot esculenta]|uniref:Uncharacterized protein n=1 Tax=Manihot esculenta TaxID=3983 RepID=A0ACB7GFF1_MANES|nr:hypothetical protein MANES_14G092850v8 [Manihot esculenta]